MTTKNPICLYNGLYEELQPGDTVNGSPSGSGTCSGTNTGDQTLNSLGGVSTNLTINGTAIGSATGITTFDAIAASSFSLGGSSTSGVVSTTARRDHTHGVPIPTSAQVGAIGTSLTINGTQIGTATTLTLTPAMIGSPATSLTINGQSLSNNITLNASNVGAVATTFTINGTQLSATGLTINASSVGAIATGLSINGMTVGTNLTLSPAQLGLMATGLTINNQSATGTTATNLVISPSNVGALASNITINGVTVSGSTPSNLNISASAMSVNGAATGSTLITGTDNTQYATAAGLFTWAQSPPTLGSTTPNNIWSYAVEYYFSGSLIFTNAQCAGTILNGYQISGATIVTLNAPGISGICTLIIFPVAVAAKISIISPSTVIFLNGVAGTAGQNIACASGWAAGAAVSLTSFKTGASTWAWWASTLSGTWVANS